MNEVIAKLTEALDLLDKLEVSNPAERVQLWLRIQWLEELAHDLRKKEGAEI